MKGARNLAYSAGLVLFFAAAPLFAAGDIAFSADSMTGSAGKQNASARLSGNAEVVSGSFTVRSDDMELTGENYRFITARGNVRGEDSEKGFSFSASGMEYDRQKEFSTFLGSVAFSDTENGVEITAGRLSYDRGSETVLMQIDVVLQKDGMTCTAAFAIYRRGQSALELTGAPFVSNDGNGGFSSIWTPKKSRWKALSAAAWQTAAGRTPGKKPAGKNPALRRRRQNEQRECPDRQNGKQIFP